MDGEQVVLTASGYPWVCPQCKNENYLAAAMRFVTCPDCGLTFEVEAVVHSIGVSDPTKILLSPASYSFICTQCEQTTYISSATKTVKCSHCNAVLDSTGLRHRIKAVPTPLMDLNPTPADDLPVAETSLGDNVNCEQEEDPPVALPEIEPLDANSTDIPMQMSLF